jgi:hypothetical protein
VGRDASAGGALMPPAKKPPEEKAKFDKPISFRWNIKKYDDHKKAKGIWLKYRGQGYADPEIFAQALIHFDGQKIKGGTQRDLVTRLERIEGKLDQQAEQNAMIVEALANMDLSAFVNTQTGRTFSEELGDRVPQSAYSQIQQTVSAQDFDVE